MLLISTAKESLIQNLTTQCVVRRLLIKHFHTVQTKGPTDSFMSKKNMLLSVMEFYKNLI